MFRLLSFLIDGLIVGALGRLLVPGRQPIGCIMTMLCGIGGALLGAVVGRGIFGPRYTPGLIMSTLGAAALVWLVTSLQRRNRWSNW